MIISAKDLVRTSCQAVVDIGFILESTDSVKAEHRKAKEFLKFFAASFGISSKGTRAGVVTFSYFGELSIKLSDHSDISSFNLAVDNIKLMGSTARIDKALCLAQRKLFRLANGGRLGVPKLLILLTYSSPVQNARVGEIADELRADGINILVVGIGRYMNATELLQIADSQQNVYITNNLYASNFVSSTKKDTSERGNAFLVCK